MSDKLQRYRQLTEIKQKAIRLKAEGETNEVISVETGTPVPTVESWVMPSGRYYDAVLEYKAFLAEKSMGMTESLMEVAVKDAVVVWDRLKSLALSQDPSIPHHVILGAIDSVLDRAGVARVSKTEGKHTLSVSDDDRKKRFAELADLQADLKPEQILRLTPIAKQQ